LALPIEAADHQQPPRGGTQDLAPYKNPDLDISERVTDLIARMTLEEKIGQMLTIERMYLKSDRDVEHFFLGSVFSAGGSAPAPNTPETWTDMVDRF
jgi:beta-glucosidase